MRPEICDKHKRPSVNSLARDLGLDERVVRLWIQGRVTPRAHRLPALDAWLAAHEPGGRAEGARDQEPEADA